MLDRVGNPSSAYCLSMWAESQRAASNVYRDNGVVVRKCSYRGKLRFSIRYCSDHISRGCTSACGAIYIVYWSENVSSRGQTTDIISLCVTIAMTTPRVRKIPKWNYIFFLDSCAWRDSVPEGGCSDDFIPRFLRRIFHTCGERPTGDGTLNSYTGCMWIMPKTHSFTTI